jgi:hypothetical protein
MVALDARWLAAPAQLEHRDLDAALREIHGERQSDRAPADDQHVGFDDRRHATSSFARLVESNRLSP